MSNEYDADATIRGMQQTIDELREMVGTKDRRIIDLVGGQVALKDQVLAAHGTIESLKIELETLMVSYQNSLNTVAATTTNLEQTKMMLTFKEGMVAGFESRIHDMERESSNQANMLTGMRKRIRELEAGVDEIVNKLETTMKQLTTAHTSNTKLIESNDALREEAAEMAAACMRSSSDSERFIREADKYKEELENYKRQVELVTADRDSILARLPPPSDEIVLDRLTLLREANLARDTLWDPHTKLSASFKANEMQSEAGEAGNVVKKLERDALGLATPSQVANATLMEQLRDELADTIIATDLLAMHYRIKLWPAIVKKFNATSRKTGFNVFL